MAFAEVGTHYGNIILVNEGFKPSTKNINGNSCLEISQKIWRLFPFSNKTVVEKLQTLQCSESRNTQQMLFLSQSKKFMAFFGSFLPVSVEFTQPFWKDAPRWSGRKRKCASWRMTHSSPARKLNLPCCSTLPTVQHTQHCCAGSLKKCSFVLWEEMNYLSLSVKIKAELLMKEQKHISLMVHPQHPFYASPQCRKLCQNSAV